MELIYIVTGTSKGLGKALFDYIQIKNKKIITVNRTADQTENSIIVDLSDIDSVVSKLNLLKSYIPDRAIIIFISNAAMIEPIAPLGNHLFKDIIKIVNINFIAPLIISNFLLGLNREIIVFNITSGAVKTKNNGLGLYSATKAGCEKVFDIANQELDDRKFHFESFDPGTMDTNMQFSLRESNGFGRRQYFRNLKDNGLLRNPNDVAVEIYNCIETILFNKGWKNE